MAFVCIQRTQKEFKAFIHSVGVLIFVGKQNQKKKVREENSVRFSTCYSILILVNSARMLNKNIPPVDALFESFQLLSHWMCADALLVPSEAMGLSRLRL